MNKQITYISFGNKSNTELDKSIKSLINLDIDTHIQVITNNYYAKTDITRVKKVNSVIVNLVNPENNIENSRYYKTRLNKYTTDLNIYLDSDTEVISKDIDKIFSILEDGYDLVICPSQNQDKDGFWHIDEKEKEYTYSMVGFQPLQLQAGVFGFRINQDTDRLFYIWHNEWNKFRNQDQAALVRALYENPVKICLLGKPFNSSNGVVLKHRFGAIRK